MEEEASPSPEAQEEKDESAQVRSHTQTNPIEARLTCPVANKRLAPTNKLFPARQSTPLAHHATSNSIEGRIGKA